MTLPQRSHCAASSWQDEQSVLCKTPTNTGYDTAGGPTGKDAVEQEVSRLLRVYLEDQVRVAHPEYSANDVSAAVDLIGGRSSPCKE